MSNIATVPNHTSGDPFSAAMWANLQGNINDGIVNQVCAARAYSTNNFNATGTFTAIPLNAERYDGDACHDNVTNNTRLTCNTAGIYHIGGCAQFQAGGGHIYLAIVVNGTTYIAINSMAADASQVCDLSVSADFLLAQGDYVELYAKSGGGLTVNAAADSSPEMWFHRV